ncbi:MAG: class I SAM-dependent methyltransferase [Paracoccaceae bacterium]|nr:class I SAM-dependent methyltransferase [Paracoccaceae bacterium]
MTSSPNSRYDAIGYGYARTRREDPRIASAIEEALGSAKSVLNVGAGTGSYEPRDRQVIAIEPSDVMVAQRPAALAPAIKASAGSVPLRDDSVDAAMAILSVHHWDEDREIGVREMRRVARGPVVLLTYDASVSARMWLAGDYFPEVAERDQHVFPTMRELAAWLGGDVRIDPIPLARDTPDWMLGSFWAHPERVLDPQARAATSGFACTDNSVVDRVVRAVARDLADGSWDARYGHLRDLAAFDVGLRLVVGNRGGQA